MSNELRKAIPEELDYIFRPSTEHTVEEILAHQRNTASIYIAEMDALITEQATKICKELGLKATETNKTVEP